VLFGLLYEIIRVLLICITDIVHTVLTYHINAIYDKLIIIIK
jgi:hypothetical protein